MVKFYGFSYALSRMGAAFAATALVFIVLFIMIEIILRSVFSTSTFIMDEFVGYAVSISVIWSLGYALENNKLIRVNLLLPHLSLLYRNILTALSAFVASFATIALISVFWTRVTRAYTRGTVSSTLAAVPTWIPETLMIIGLSIFALQLFAYGLRHLTGHPSPAPLETLINSEQTVSH